MLSPEERRLIVGILLLLLFGAGVKACRPPVRVQEIPKETVPGKAPATKGLSEE